MKKIGLVLLSQLITLVSVWGIQDSIVSDSVVTKIVEEKPMVSVQLENFDFEFKNHKHETTLKPYDYGKVTLNWADDKINNQFVGVKYSVKGENNWQEIIVEGSDSTIVLDSLPENSFFDYYLGTGNSESDISYSSTLESFHSLSPYLFTNKYAVAKTEGVKILWAIKNNLLSEIIENYPDAHFIIKYNTDIGAKQHKANSEVAPWTVSDPISINEVAYKMEDLSGGEKYKYKVGLVVGEKIIWSGKGDDKGAFKPKRAWGIFKILVLLGALCMFIFGMKNMSEGLQQAAGNKLRGMLSAITSNRVKGVFTGFGITSLVQSSSVTTVMTVSFVNAGLMNLRQSAGVMMGANIGTTITAWLILILGFKLSLSSYALIFIAFGATMLFFGKGKLKYWGTAVIGFALLFMGLGLLKENVPSLSPDSPIVQFFIDFKDVWYGPVMFVGLGALVTVVIQSSSAAMALTMILVSGGVLPFEVASAMILGENIGTTITAELASLIGNVHAKRSARIHSLFNVIGVTWAILLFPFILDGIAMFMDGDPYSDPAAANVGLAIFHTSFNSLNVILLLGFVPQLVSLAERSVKSKGEADEEFKLDFIGGPIGSTAEICIVEAKKEVSKFGEVTARINKFADVLLNSPDRKEKSKMYKKIAKYEEITDRVEIEIATYLGRAATLEMSEDASIRMRGMLSISNDLERIGDIYYQMSKTLERKEQEKRWFTPEQRDGINQMSKLVAEAFSIMNKNLKENYGSISMEAARAKENEINKLRNKLRKQHMASMKAEDYNMHSSLIYNDLFSSYEKVGDHIINVSEAVAGEI